MWYRWRYTHSTRISTRLPVRPIPFSSVLFMSGGRLVWYRTSGTASYKPWLNWHHGERCATPNSLETLSSAEQRCLGPIRPWRYADITSWCLAEGPACTTALLQELSQVSLLKFHSTFDGSGTRSFWHFVSSIVDKLHHDDQVSRDCPLSALGIFTNVPAGSWENISWSHFRPYGDLPPRFPMGWTRSILDWADLLQTLHPHSPTQVRKFAIVSPSEPMHTFTTANASQDNPHHTPTMAGIHAHGAALCLTCKWIPGKVALEQPVGVRNHKFLLVVRW